MAEAAPSLGDAARAQCQAWLDAGREQRAYTRPTATASPDQVHAAMLEVRGRLDRLEGILTEIIGYRAGLKTRARELADVAQDAWDAEIDRRQRGAVRREWEGAQERYALARVATMEQHRRARVAQQVVDPVAAVEEQVRGMYFGLRDLSRELSASLRFLEFEHYLERQ